MALTGLGGENDELSWAFDNIDHVHYYDNFHDETDFAAVGDLHVAGNETEWTDSDGDPVDDDELNEREYERGGWTDEIVSIRPLAELVWYHDEAPGYTNGYLTLPESQIEDAERTFEIRYDNLGLGESIPPSTELDEWEDDEFAYDHTVEWAFTFEPEPTEGQVDFYFERMYEVDRVLRFDIDYDEDTETDLSAVQFIEIDSDDNEDVLIDDDWDWDSQQSSDHVVTIERPQDDSHNREDRPYDITINDETHSADPNITGRDAGDWRAIPDSVDAALRLDYVKHEMEGTRWD